MTTKASIEGNKNGGKFFNLISVRTLSHKLTFLSYDNYQPKMVMFAPKYSQDCRFSLGNFPRWLDRSNQLKASRQVFPFNNGLNNTTTAATTTHY